MPGATRYLPIEVFLFEFLFLLIKILKFQGPGWEYETRLPSWAQSEWQDDEY